MIESNYCVRRRIDRREMKNVKEGRFMKLGFLGATHQVTGSSYILDADGIRILVDCGLFQERDYVHRNWEAFPVPPDQINCLLLTHVHLDHSGLIPKLVKEGFAGDILLTPPSKEHQHYLRWW